jgi:hypothetical protein
MPLALISRDAILSKKNLKPKIEPVLEWAENGGEIPSIGIKRLSGAERQELGNKLQKLKDDGPIERLIFVTTIVDENNQRLFTDDDVSLLVDAYGAPVSRLSRLALSLNGFGKESIEEHEKN